jgi:iron complex outermembrane recepter protein
MDNPQLKPSYNYNFFNPKAGLTEYIVNRQDEKQKIYLSGAVAHREPNHDDFDIDYAHQPTRETLYDGELGYQADKKKWTFNANAYYMYYRDQLVLTGQVNSVGAYTQTNVPESYRRGIELIASVQATPWLRISANATASQNKITHFTEYLDRYDSLGNYQGQSSLYHGTTDIGYAPSMVGAASLAIAPFPRLRHAQHLEIDINEKYVGLEYLDNTSNAGRAIPAYSFCNILLRYSVRARPFKELAATLALNNIFNSLYSNNGFTYPYIANNTVVTENYYFPQAGFNVLGGLSLRW